MGATSRFRGVSGQTLQWQQQRNSFPKDSKSDQDQQGQEYIARVIGQDDPPVVYQLRLQAPGRGDQARDYGQRGPETKEEDAQGQV